MADYERVSINRHFQTGKNTVIIGQNHRFQASKTPFLGGENAVFRG
jgi:hypothetical protein